MIKIVRTSLIVLFSLTSISVAAERDCSNPKGFHQKLMCKKIGSKLKMPKLPKIGGNETASAEAGTESNNGIIKRLKAKTLKDMFFPKAD
jgi:hypothetical protein|tara:strand:- start:5757 stop:6026 length:270 start_codon:yes stop_codon:yes gene_type:complete